MHAHWDADGLELVKPHGWIKVCVFVAARVNTAGKTIHFEHSIYLLGESPNR